MNKKVDHPGFLKMLDYHIHRSSSHTEQLPIDNQIKMGNMVSINDNQNKFDSIFIVYE